MKFLFYTTALALLFSSCQSHENAPTDSVLSDFEMEKDTSIYNVAADSIKLVKTASINMKVKDAMQASRQIGMITKQMGGILHHRKHEAVELENKTLHLSADSILQISSINTYADLTVRVPSEHLDSFIYKVHEIGYFTNVIQMDVDDKSLHYRQQALMQQNRNKALAAINTKTNTITGAQKRIEIQDQAIEQQISREAIDGDVRFSTLQIHLFQNAIIRKEMMAHTDLSLIQLSWAKRFKNAIIDGWHFFSNIILLLAYSWVFILIALIGYRYNNKKQNLTPATKSII